MICMAKLDLTMERDHVDRVTEAMHSLSFLLDASNVIFGIKRDSVTLGQFYDSWLRSSGAPQHKIPFSLGAILGYLCCGILFAKEHWFDLVPDVLMGDLSMDWVLSEVRGSVSAPKAKAVTARYVVRRIRNALGHGSIEVLSEAKERSQLLTHTSIVFRDVDFYDPADTFDATASLDVLTRFIKRFQHEIHQHVRSKVA